MSGFRLRNFGALAIGLAVTVALSAPADARRGGSFGSRGARTHHAPKATAVAPAQTAPVQRSMTENRNGSQAAGRQPQAGKMVPAKSGGLAKGLIGGLIAGGLIGALLGGGLGALAGAGFLIALLQAALVGGVILILFRMFRRKPMLAAAHGGAMKTPFMGMEPRQSPMPTGSRGFSGAPFAGPAHDIEIRDDDKQAFERLLVEVQDAFGQEDYARLRERTTPEVMSYFAEELSQNATSGRRNTVTGTRLIDAEVAEAWREASIAYATIAMRYESIDVMLDRNSGAVIEGDPTRATQTTELWTFAREAHGPWRLSAVQQA
ncbi:TIM44-like domain-containing protein [Sphingomonas sp. LaA6.9]|uniref:Tim44 domain-containing protein n=1 Tax=Sphingomonas sp. LaA6.9 TaxID=2919914 RepID=UPI001F4F9FB1|nr:TIM44-like domain-containing protein [Sphingomonas sp. LaA6.9]MCJ8159849.1 TIM44-like domain-containing protein [Sphingomonas sp. LaA6.9]